MHRLVAVRQTSGDVVVPPLLAARWFVFSIEFVVILIAMGVAASGKLNSMRGIIVGLAAVCVILYIQVSASYEHHNT